MKVLMLGWEFPPHISGGLGTACAGLTQALEKENVDVLFVVPKLHGGEHADKTTFINASSIPIRQKKRTNLAPPASPVVGSTSEARTEQADSLGPHIAAIATIQIPSTLAAYFSPDDDNSGYGLQRWNYSFVGQSQSRPVDAPDQQPSDLQSRIQYIKHPYNFSGTYGSKLLEEVDRYAQAVAEIARRNSFDVIHAHDWMTYKAGIAAQKISGKPLVVHVHATEIDRSGAHVNRKVFSIEKEGMLQSDKVVAVSHWTKNIAVKHYQIAEEKIAVVHNGISPKQGTSILLATPPIGAQVITFLGRITHQKGPLYFVEAARKVHQHFPDAHYVVAGSGDQLPIMIERIAQLKLSGNFHFTGFLKGDDIDRVWSMSSVYVMPSVSEPFGIAPLEAIQAGVPVILSKQAGVSEVMPHAIKVNFWDTDAFAEAICNVLRYKSLSNTLKENGAEAIKHITWNKAARKLTTLYHDLSKHYQKKKKPRSILSGTSTKTTSHAPVL